MNRSRSRSPLTKVDLATDPTTIGSAAPDACTAAINLAATRWIAATSSASGRILMMTRASTARIFSSLLTTSPRRDRYRSGPVQSARTVLV